MKAVRRKLEVPMPAAMPCKKPMKNSGETHCCVGKRTTGCACGVDADKLEFKSWEELDTNLT